MPYRLRKNEPVAEGVKRVAAEQIDHACGQLAQKSDTEKAVHEARKNVKKTRALLLLAGYGGEDKRLRNIGRALSELRDAAVMIEVFDALLEKHQAALKKESFAGIRRGLVESMRSADAGRAVTSALAGLHAARQRLERWPIEDALSDGLETSYRRGRKALARATKNGAPQNYHDFRKRVKEHWYHMRLLGSLESRTAGLKELEGWLGDHHNLAVLQEKLEKSPERFGDEEWIKLFLALATNEQQELAQNSISLGRRLYEQKPKQFIHSLSPKKPVGQTVLPSAIFAGKRSA
jgi:CHAD domain-containing protein